MLSNAGDLGGLYNQLFGGNSANTTTGTTGTTGTTDGTAFGDVPVVSAASLSGPSTGELYNPQYIVTAKDLNDSLGNTTATSNTGEIYSPTYGDLLSNTSSGTADINGNTSESASNLEGSGYTGPSSNPLSAYLASLGYAV